MTEEYINKKKLLEDIRRAASRSSLGETSEPYLDWKDVVAFILEAPVIEADIDELKKEVADLNNRRHLIWAIGVDYDGCNTVESLKELIDELVSYTQLPREQVPDITSRTGTWIDVSVEPDRVRWKCSSCGKETSLPNYDKANYCFNCGAKMKEENS
jgi:DNA-directed RNA polymerase subunit RPC12/RpoP/polyhydroxyalkanoate synthesis regulator phasin